MKKYKDNVILTDDNYDDELEEIQKYFDIVIVDSSFVQKLPSGFDKQNNKGVEEWIKVDNYNDGYQEGSLAYEFSNGFMVVDFIMAL